MSRYFFQVGRKIRIVFIVLGGDVHRNAGQVETKFHKRYFWGVWVVGVVGALSVTFGDSSPRGRAKSVGGGDSDEDADSSRTHKERAFGRPGG